MTEQSAPDNAFSHSIESSPPKRIKVQSRNEPFSKRASTRIWSEAPSADNPYIAQTALCHGYDLFELMEKRSFIDVFYLLFRGELPSPSQAQLLQGLMIALINPGPRHPATRAAMNAGIGKTNPLHILPIASSVLGGEYLGGGEIENAMRFFRKYQQTSAAELSELSLSDEKLLTPGFGKRHGGVDLLVTGIANRLAAMDGAGDALKWGNQFAQLQESKGIGWLTTGIAAAVFADLGFHPKYGGALFQLLGAPGLVAHGMEVSNKPITAMPYVSDDNYVLER